MPVWSSSSSDEDVNDSLPWLHLTLLNKKQNIQDIDVNKDSQENAVYAFTIVTVIFLPLSTVAGILGMNTNDVRNMELTQWIFWAVAIPLTLVIIVLSLMWTGELKNLWNSFQNLWRESPMTTLQAGEGYTSRPSPPYPMMPARFYGPPPPPPPGFDPYEEQIVPISDAPPRYTSRTSSGLYGNRRRQQEYMVPVSVPHRPYSRY